MGCSSYHLGCFLLLHLRAHLRHAPINRLTVLCQAFRVYLHVCASVTSYYLAIYASPLWVYGKQNFYAAKNMAEHRNVGTSYFFATFQCTYWFCKICYEYEKKSSPTVRSDCSAVYVFQFLVLCLCRVNLPGKHRYASAGREAETAALSPPPHPASMHIGHQYSNFLIAIALSSKDLQVRYIPYLFSR